LKESKALALAKNGIQSFSFGDNKMESKALALAIKKLMELESKAECVPLVLLEVFIDRALNQIKKINSPTWP
jgi:hypothetical protein